MDDNQTEMAMFIAGYITDEILGEESISYLDLLDALASFGFKLTKDTEGDAGNAYVLQAVERRLNDG